MDETCTIPTDGSGDAGAGSLAGAVLAHVALGALLAVYLSTTIAALTELFPTKVRYGGFSIGYNISVAIFGGRRRSSRPG